ncbi:DNA-binding protein [Priestia koreensis]|uniref:DNA-binding protein n=1 Tax=Priestia koreensis TaxID=284581 RepID=UPI0006A9F45F|nr:DNA-binding protein [Priestia koreensis]MCM3005592.1 DNA-binding protein [Priestia koreensis]
MELNDELREFMLEEILMKQEVMDLLGIAKQTMSLHLKNEKIKPFKQVGSIQIFLKSDVLEFQKALEVTRKQYRPYDFK